MQIKWKSGAAWRLPHEPGAMWSPCRVGTQGKHSQSWISPAVPGMTAWTERKLLVSFLRRHPLYSPTSHKPPGIHTVNRMRKFNPCNFRKCLSLRPISYLLLSQVDGGARRATLSGLCRVLSVYCTNEDTQLAAGLHLSLRNSQCSGTGIGQTFALYWWRSNFSGYAGGWAHFI